MSLDIILGPMFAGKSSRILSIVSRHTSVGQRVLVLKHADDSRYGIEDDVITHDQRRVSCQRIQTLNDVRDEDILRFAVIILDEAQFFPGLVAFVQRVVERYNKCLFLVGLDGDFNRRPFGELLECIPLADRVERITALCRRCGDGTPGLFTHRRHGPHDQQVIVGGAHLYEPLCRACSLRQVDREEPPR
jgi:thymidine kinase